jgi:hypothetical protein
MVKQLVIMKLALLRKTTTCCNSTSYRKIQYNGIVCNNSNCSNMLNNTKLRPSKASQALKACLPLMALILVIVPPSPSSSSRFNYTYSVGVKKNYLPELNETNFIAALLKAEVICPDIVFAQAKLESGHFKSKYTKKLNNMFGMRYPFKRKTKAAGIYLVDGDTIIKGTQEELRKDIVKYSKMNHYAYFETWIDAVEDHRYWQEATFNLEQKYLTHIDKIYAEDTVYISKVNTIRKKFK